MKQLGVSGAMVWSLENDDFKGECGVKFPFLNKVYDMINGIDKNSYECLLGPTTPIPTTPEPTTPEPTTPEPTTPEPTTPEPTTPEPTTPEPTTPEPTTPEPTTPEPTTPEPTPQPTTTEEPKYTTIIDNHVIKCYKQGPIPHPTNIHKYIVCNYVATEKGGGWWVIVMPCPIGTRWHDVLKTCVADN